MCLLLKMDFTVSFVKNANNNVCKDFAPIFLKFYNFAEIGKNIRIFVFVF